MKAISVLMLLCFATAGYAASKPEPSPVVWGALSQNKACVIFQEGHKTTGMFWGVAVTTKTMGKLTVIETQNYTMGEDAIVETQENMDALMERAQRDMVKFVKIPEKHSPELLEKPRERCK